MPPTLDMIAPELLLDIAEYLPVRDLQALIRCNRLLYNLLLHSLYKQAVAFAPLTPEAHLHREFMPNTWKNYPWMGNARQLGLCLATGLDKDMILGSSGATLLHRTASWSQDDALEVMRLLLAHGADVNVKDLMGMTPLHLVAESWYPLVDVSEPIQMLMQSGANIDAANNAGRVALHLALRRSCVSAVELLLYHGADPNKVDYQRRSPLYYAMKSCRSSEMVTLLLEHGADLKTEDHRGDSPLHYALHYDRSPEMVQLLLQHGADLNHVNRNGRTPLYTAIRYCPEMVELLLKEGADPNHADSMAESLVHYAVHYAPRDRLDPCVDSSPLALLLQHGADPNKVDHNSMTPLHWVSCLDPEKIKLLLKHGADPNIADDKGMTRLHYALSGIIWICPKVVRLLLDHGTDPNKGDVDGKTALHYAVPNPGIVALLLERRADPNKGDAEGRTPLQYLLRKLDDSDDWRQKENERICESVRVLMNARALVEGLGEAERELVKEICEPRTQHTTTPAETMSGTSLPSALDHSTHTELTETGITMLNMPRDDDKNGWQVVKYKQKQSKGKGKGKRKAKCNQGMKDSEATPTKKGGEVAERRNGRGKEREEKEGKEETMTQDGKMEKSDQERRPTWAEVAGRLNVRQ
jgi:ankyrin repeat protein